MAKKTKKAVKKVSQSAAKNAAKNSAGKTGNKTLTTHQASGKKTAQRSKNNAGQTSPIAKKSSKKTGPGLLDQVGNFGLNLMGQIESALGSKPDDIVAAIKADHASLREYLKLLKDTDQEMSARKQAYTSFSSLLKSHSSSEEKAVYEVAQHLVGHEIHTKTAEGFVEHQLADDLMKRIEKAKDPLVWSAHANVLAEIVEHHLDEEESDFLPLLRKKSRPEQNLEMVLNFSELRSKSQKKVTPKNAGILK